MHLDDWHRSAEILDGTLGHQEHQAAACSQGEERHCHLQPRTSIRLPWPCSSSRAGMCLMAPHHRKMAGSAAQRQLVLQFQVVKP